ncbi:ATP11-domain-containing protein [Ceraceosorus guamensis]|uniref:ATP11-domain-containing protein n=1 Tax=Ceraceosorus guamensis TaxID=1522189 RepID=A0A316W0R9_9BASI|nr:ATP11-domain-containing protein [Ceraceosorus guamensis]PWN43342.1 ATP11-domain-containing protein [Ceraceosorus guamensis]
MLGPSAIAVARTAGGLRQASSSVFNAASKPILRQEASLPFRRRDSTSALRSLSSTSLSSASVSAPSLSEVLDASPLASNSNGTTPAQRAREANLSPQERRTLLEQKKERKLKEYESRLKVKAMEQGLSLDELTAQARQKSEAAARARVDAAKAAADSFAASQQGQESEFTSSNGNESLEQRDARLAAEIRARAEAEAKRKLESGDVGSGPGGSGVKPLSSIIALEKLIEADPGKIGELWTSYHTLKNKLSAVVPSHMYSAMVERGQKYKQFVLPLPRKISVSPETDDVQGESEKQGYEMYLCEWATLPPPPKPPVAQGAAPEAAASPLRPATVLFTPLAEYQLRQEYAQPVLVVTYYTDLSSSKGVVLMRGEVTEASNAEAAPTGFQAAAAAAARGASEAEQEKLTAPLQSEAKLSQQDAQLLIMSLQRFYLPAVANASGAQEREELLQTFHREPEKFDVDRLCKLAFALV